MTNAALATGAPTSGAPLDQLATLHKALSDPLRLTILRLLLQDSFGVLELSRILDIRQPALSHHLKVLASAQLVSTRREGNSIFYRRAFVTDEDPLRELKSQVFQSIDALPLSTAQSRKIRQLRLERSQLSLNYFNRNADKLREKQGLIVAHDDYAAAFHDVIDGLGLQPEAAVLEVGPGEGLLLTELAAKFARLTGLDNSRDMLERSRRAVTDAGFNEVELILGDTGVALARELHCDLIIFEMVLHHISSPANTFRDCAEILNAGGYLLLAELSPHDQDWVREACGDLWLGFEKQELDRWAADAGLSSDQATYLQLRNGFQIQVCVYKKET